MKQLLILLIMLCNVTAYTASFEECGKTDGITASGVKATENHTIACDFLAFGAQVRILDTLYVAEDRIGGGYLNKIDIYMESKEKAFEWGNRQMEVEIKEE